MQADRRPETSRTWPLAWLLAATLLTGTTSALAAGQDNQTEPAPARGVAGPPQMIDETKPDATGKSANILRPSIEVVASELSRKYLNLEHGNWRLKPTGAGGSQQQATPAAARGEAEQVEREISYQPDGSSRPTDGPFVGFDSDADGRPAGADGVAGDPAASHSSSTADSTSAAGRAVGKRARKSDASQQPAAPDAELAQCRQYLRGRGPEEPPAPLGPANSQRFPCSCERRLDELWLTCDHVQLIGFSPTGADANTSSQPVARFSQRDSGLQLVQSQKFHLLRLYHLKAVDLSANRIRQIKSDAFHGLESQLEYLNLASNLLGDARAVFDSQHGGKLAFSSDQLSGLRSLRWLSLRDNQIGHIAEGSFVRLDNSLHSAQLAHSLKYLDLGDNLLRFVPSDAIHLLGSLERLDLSGNRIGQLDQLSKFPRALRHLDLSENLIKVIRQSDLIDLPDLIELNLSHNQLSQLDQSAFVSQATKSPVAPQSALVADGERRLAEAKSRQRRQLGEPDDLIADESAETPEEELEASESLGEPTKGRPGDEPTSNFIQSSRKLFNATLRLNLSYNFFELIPGDSLLKFPNLQQLDLSFNRIRRLDTNYLCSIYNLVDSLRLLDLSGNLLSLQQQQQQQQQQHQNATQNERGLELNKLFGCLQKLEKLLLSTNRVASVGSSPNSEANDDQDGGQPSAERLVIRFGEGFTSKHLVGLDLSDNQLRWMPIFEQVSSQPFALFNVFNTNLQLLQTNQTQISNWLNYRVHLETLNLNYNYLERLDEHDFQFLFNLRHLHLDQNKLSHLPVALMQRFTNLETISLQGNRLSSLSPINELLLRSARTLKRLNLANNRLVDWPPISSPSQASPAPESASSSNFNREFRQNTQSSSQSILSFALEELNLEGNLLTSGNVSSLFDQLTYMKSLRTLNLSFNLLQKVKSEWFKFANGNLRRLLLTGNKINSIDLGSFAQNQVNELRQLNLDFNLLKELKRKTFDSLAKIEHLNLGHNLIHTINSETFHQINSLKILKLNNNKLSSWKCEYFSNLCNSISGNINADLETLLAPAPGSRGSVSALLELDLSHNSLSQLRANSISVHTKLTRLNLAHNKLSFIPHDLFKASASSGSQLGRLSSSLRYLNLAHNRIQTIENINFRPLRHLHSLDLSFNELQTLGVDVVFMDSQSIQRERSSRRVVVSNNLTNLLHEDELFHQSQSLNQSDRSLEPRPPIARHSNWPTLSKLRHLNLANNQITLVNQSILAELSPFALLNLNLSANYLDSESLPYGFYTKVAASPTANKQDYDLIFTLKLESLDLSRNRLSEFPANLLDTHHTSLELCDLAFNRIQSLVEDSDSMIQIKSLNLQFNPLNRESSELILFEQRNARSLNLAATRLFAIQQVIEQADQLAQANSGAQLKHRLANQTSQLDLIRSISRPIDAPYLRHLNLSSNQLVWLAASVFDKMHSLQSLDLSNNQLTRLNLLSGQLSHVSATLDYLNLGSNLFTSIDSNDLSQLTKLRHLDLSNLLSLQKMNCKFLAKLTSLRALKLFNFPQMRSSLSSTLSSLSALKEQTSERLLRKVLGELLVSTIGSHCFGDSDSSPTINGQDPQRHLSWFNLEQLELELFNNFDSLERTSEAFGLSNELAQLLGPKLTKLTLIGANLTQLADDSLVGVAGDELELKISYTSLGQPPLRQILASVAKRTKLYLDFRNNNIQSIDAANLQHLDELQQPAGGQHEERPTLRLAQNPFRCDCQTRPLWLWLNQRWASSELSPATSQDGEQTGDAASSYWLKLNTLSQSSDLKCHQPAKLRGKLMQHVYYNDLVCSSQTGGQPAASQQRQSRRRNETTRVSAEQPEELDEDELYDSESRPEVRLTRFNRFPQSVRNLSLFLTGNMPFLRAKSAEAREPPDDDADSPRPAKRDHSSAEPQPADEQQASNTRYSRHRPNTQQRHSHFSTLTNLNQVPLTKSVHSRSAASSSSSLLTDSDVWILTLMSIAMTVMAFVIIIICLFKYKMDQSDKERILNSHGKMLLSNALFVGDNLIEASNGKLVQLKSQLPSGSSSSSSSKRPKGARTKSSSGQADQPRVSANANGGSSRSAKITKKPQHYASQQVLVPISHGPLLRPPQNFLMRSPTIRRMQGLATNASDWFKFTLRAYPSSAASRRRRIFMNESVNCASQLTTAKLASQLKQPDASNLPPGLSPSGCPIHAFRAVQKSRNISRSRTSVENLGEEEQCSYCKRLLAAVQQTKVHRLMGETRQSSEQNLGYELDRPTSEQPAEMILEPSKSCDQSNTDQLTTNDRADEVEFISPKLIKAIAKQMDREHEGRMVALESERYRRYQRNQAMGASSSAYSSSRDQQARSMRTFGINHNNRSSTNTLASTTIQPSESSDQVQSQIPTVDVDGHFAYQSESQIDSPTNCDASNSVQESGTEVNALSPALTDQNDIFILIHEDQAKRPPSRTAASITTTSTIHKLTGQANGPSSPMNDQCSHSSSPVAYGFMRSTPSATTLSSGRDTQNQYVVNQLTENFQLPRNQLNDLELRNGGFPRLYSNDSDGSNNFTAYNQGAQFNNNNDTSYLVATKTMPVMLISEPQDASSNSQLHHQSHHHHHHHHHHQQPQQQTNEEQIIVSRL